MVDGDCIVTNKDKIIKYVAAICQNDITECMALSETEYFTPNFNYFISFNHTISVTKGTNI